MAETPHYNPRVVPHLGIDSNLRQKNSNIPFRSDNKAVTDILNKQSSKKPKIMKIVHPLVLILVNFNISLRMEHLAGSLNVLPDKISRF